MRYARRDLAAVGRGEEIVDGMGCSTIGRTQGGDIDNLALARLVSDDEIEIVRTRRTLFVEGAAAIVPIASREPEASSEGRDFYFKRGAGRDRIQNGTRMRTLRLHPCDGLRIERFHVAVVIRDLLPPQRFRHRLHRGRRGRRRRVQGCERVVRHRHRGGAGNSQKRDQGAGCYGFHISTPRSHCGRPELPCALPAAVAGSRAGSAHGQASPSRLPHGLDLHLPTHFHDTRRWDPKTGCRVL